MKRKSFTAYTYRALSRIRSTEELCSARRHADCRKGKLGPMCKGCRKLKVAIEEEKSNRRAK